MNITKELKKHLAGVNLTEDTLIKLKLMIEREIKARTKSLREEIAATKKESDLRVKRIKAKADEYGQYIVNEMADKVDAYSDYVVEQFIKDNKESLIEHKEYARMKKVFDRVKRSFEDGMFKLDESSAVTKIQNKLDESTKAYNKLFEETVALKKKLDEQQYAIVFESLTKDLADTQREKVANLIENISFASVNEFKRGVELMIEEIVASSKSEQLNEVGSKDPKKGKPAPQFNDKMSQYLSRL
jgi:hypothetical protein